MNIKPLPEFDKVFEVCEGSMCLMDTFFHEYLQEPTNEPIHKDPTNFHVVMREEIKILTALSPDEVRSLEEGEHPKWTQEKVLDLMKDLTTTRAGVNILDYSTMCFKFGSGVVNSMIKYNIIRLRPTSRLAYDVPNHVNPIITAESPAAYVAMKKVLGKHWKRESDQFKHQCLAVIFFPIAIYTYFKIPVPIIIAILDWLY